MFDAGAIEMLAVEVSRELISVRETEKARNRGDLATKPLVAKGVSFCSISLKARPN